MWEDGGLGGEQRAGGRREMEGGGHIGSRGADGENRELWGGGGRWGSVGSHEAVEGKRELWGGGETRRDDEWGADRRCGAERGAR